MFTSRYAGKRRLLSLATAVALVSPGVTLAQDEADESATDELEEIVVTGTRLQKQASSKQHRISLLMRSTSLRVVL